MSQFVDASADAMDSLKVLGNSEVRAQRNPDEGRLACNPDFLAWQEELREAATAGRSAAPVGLDAPVVDVCVTPEVLNAMPA